MNLLKRLASLMNLSTSDLHIFSASITVEDVEHTMEATMDINNGGLGERGEANISSPSLYGPQTGNGRSKRDNQELI